MKRHLVILSLLLLVQQSVAKAEFHGHPELAAKAEHIKRIHLLPPQIDMFALGIGESLEKMSEWEQPAQSNIRHALMTEFARREHLTVTEFDESSLPPSLRASYDETLLLYETVWAAIVTHAFKWQYMIRSEVADYIGPDAQDLFFPEKARDFRYSLGSEVGDIAGNSDALLIIRCIDRRSTVGRIALGVSIFIIGASMYQDVELPQAGVSLFTASLIDAKTGDILWFSHSVRSLDLRDPEDAQKLAVEFLIDLPVLGKAP